MPIKKSDLYSTLWKSCDELRGGMDASQYKDYVLTLLFVKYVSDKYAGQRGALIVVPAGGSFADMVRLRGTKDIGDGINKIIGALAKANELVGVINQADFNDDGKLGKGRDMQDRLSNLIGIFQNPALDFSRNRAEGDDLLGDAYEYLMRNFATQSGKSKGQFYTPAEVSRIIALVIDIGPDFRQDQSIYDPTNGSGSLVLKAADQAPHGASIYGQEMDNATYALARMNLILHNYPDAEMWNGNTLADPHFKNPDGTLKTFDRGVSNPPFSLKSWSNGVNVDHDPYRRWELGVPPAKNGDYAFLLHLLCSLKSTGKGAIILPHGVLFRGNAEAVIRKNIVNRGYIKGIIGLPPNLFYGTGIPACIIVLDKEHAAGRKGILMLDASKGFIKDGNKNRLRHQDIHRIVDVFNHQLEIPRYARLVPHAEIADARNDYNLNIPRYIDSSEPEDLQDIDAHLHGDIPDRDVEALGRYWQVCPTLKAALFRPAARPDYSAPQVTPAECRPAVQAHPEFVAYTQTVEQVWRDWQARNTPILKNIAVDAKPKGLIKALSEDLLQAFANVPLLDAYDIYQHLMTYWTEVMQDDVYLIAADGWAANPELIPEPLVIARYGAAEQQALDQLQAHRDALASHKEEMQAEHGDEDGWLDPARFEKEKVNKASVMKRQAEIGADPDAADELKVLGEYYGLLMQEVEAGKAIKEAEAALAKKVAAQYKALGADEVKVLVVDDKWMAALHAAVMGELDRVSQALTGRVQELAERYAAPLPQLEANVETLTARVEAHLQTMGHAWK